MKSNVTAFVSNTVDIKYKYLNQLRNLWELSNYKEQAVLMKVDPINFIIRINRMSRIIEKVLNPNESNI